MYGAGDKRTERFVDPTTTVYTRALVTTPVCAPLVDMGERIGSQPPLNKTSSLQSIVSKCTKPNYGGVEFHNIQLLSQSCTYTYGAIGAHRLHSTTYTDRDT